MYIIKCGNFTYEISERNIIFAALLKARDMRENVNLDTNQDAIRFLNSIGYEVVKDEIHN